MEAHSFVVVSFLKSPSDESGWEVATNEARGKFLELFFVIIY